MYDHIIVGAGPAGLTLATYLPGRNCLLERQSVAGGCHRVLPEYASFVEHGPRVYSGSYVNMHKVLNDIGVSWKDHFDAVYYSPELIDGKHWYRWMSHQEIVWLSVEYLLYCIVPNHGKSISMKEYCTSKGFCPGTMDKIDLVCRWSDGGGSDRYTLWQFLSGLDQHSKSFYVPSKPLGTLFEYWVRWLQSNKACDIFMSANVTRVSPTTVSTEHGVFAGKKVILCIPPVYASRLLKASGLLDPEFQAFSKATKYNPYWSVSFYTDSWDNSQGHRSTPYGVVAVQYPFGVLSAAGTRFDVPNERGVMLKDLSDDEAAQEIRRQLGLSENVPYAYLQGPYNDQSFVMTPQHQSYPAALPGGVDVVGTHNGHSTYHFTSMESAIQNALVYTRTQRETAWNISDWLYSVGLVVGLGLCIRS